MQTIVHTTIHYSSERVWVTANLISSLYVHLCFTFCVNLPVTSTNNINPSCLGELHFTELEVTTQSAMRLSCKTSHPSSKWDPSPALHSNMEFLIHLLPQDLPLKSAGICHPSNWYYYPHHISSVAIFQVVEVWRVWGEYCLKLFRQTAVS